jgi:hypothetical protein
MIGEDEICGREVNVAEVDLGRQAMEAEATAFFCRRSSIFFRSRSVADSTGARTTSGSRWSMRFDSVDTTTSSGWTNSTTSTGEAVTIGAGAIGSTTTMGVGRIGSINPISKV